MLTLTYMPADHVPVLAAELIDLLDPSPGQTIVDCTFGAGGHARLVADRIGPEGELHLHRPRPGCRLALRRVRRRGPLRDELSSRRLRRRAGRARRRRPRARRHLPRLRPLLDADRRLGARLLLLLRRPARHADGPRRSADRRRPRQRVARAPADRDASQPRRGAPRAPDRRRDRAPPAVRDDRRARRRDPRRGPAGRPLRPRPSGEAHLPGAADRRQRGARLASTAPCRSPGRCSPSAGSSRRSPSTRSRTGG